MYDLVEVISAEKLFNALNTIEIYNESAKNIFISIDNL